MNIVYSTSDLYAPLAGISLTSLLINNIAQNEIHIFIMDNNISKENKAKLTETVEGYGRDITFIPLDESLKNTKINIQKWNISTFGRLFEASSLPDLDKVIHIDCDTIVNGSLESIWNMDMSHAVVAGAPDCLSDAYKSNIGLDVKDTYINAGFLVFNLKRIRELDLERIFFEYIKDNSTMLTYVDQEVLNACIPEDEKIELPLSYNSYTILHYLKYDELRKLRHAKHLFSKEAYVEARNNPNILHFTGCFLEGTRPWIKNDSHPKGYLFKRYKKQSKWRDMPEWNDERSLKNKLISQAVRLMPMEILAPLVGYIHGVYIPNKNKKIRDGEG